MDRITINPNQCGDRPCIRGMLAGGASEAEILEDDPDLEAQDIRASLACE